MTDIFSSRAMAVAALEGKVFLYVLNSIDQMRTNFKEKSRLEPIKEVSIQSVYSVHTSRLMIVLP